MTNEHAPGRESRQVLAELIAKTIALEEKLKRVLKEHQKDADDPIDE